MYAIKIALFTETYLPQINGVATHVKALKDGLEQCGNTVLVVTADTQTHRHYVESGVLRCPAREIKNLYQYGLSTPYSLERLRIIKAFAPDIIHVHTEFGIGLSGIEIAQYLKIPIVYTLHTMWDEYLHYIAPGQLMPAARTLSHAYLRYFAKRTTAITGPSPKVQAFLRRCGANRDVSVVPNPVDLNLFCESKVSKARIDDIKREYKIAPDDMLACFCGRLGAEKSVDVLLDYFAAKHQKSDRMKLMIIGDGPARPELEEQVRRLGIADSILFTGRVEHEKLAAYYACCNLYVTASRSDTNSISMLEAMAMGLPVLHILDELNTGQVIEGVNGYIFRNADELYAALCRFRDFSPKERQTLRDSVKASVQVAGQETLAANLVSIYEKVEQPQKIARITA